MDTFWKKATLPWKSEEDKKTSLSALEKATKALIHNIMSIVSITALVHGTTKIQPVHVRGAQEYIAKKCNTRVLKHAQKGGDALGVPYVTGVNNSMYAENNGGSSDASTINFDTQLARFGLMIHGAQANFVESDNGMQGGASRSKQTVSLSWIESEMRIARDHYRLHLSKTARADIIQLIKYHLACLMHDILKSAPISHKKVHDILEKKKYAVFH